MYRSCLAVALALVAVAHPVSAQSPTGVEFLNSGKVVGKSFPLSEAVRVGDTLYLSGVVGIGPGETKLVPGGLAPEARQTLTNIRTMLEANGLGLRDVVKCTVMLADIGEWGHSTRSTRNSSAPRTRRAPRSAPADLRSARASRWSASQPTRAERGSAGERAVDELDPVRDRHRARLAQVREATDVGGRDRDR